MTVYNWRSEAYRNVNGSYCIITRCYAGKKPPEGAGEAGEHGAPGGLREQNDAEREAELREGLIVGLRGFFRASEGDEGGQENGGQ